MSQPAGSSQAPIAEVDMQTCSNQIVAGTVQYANLSICNRAPCNVHNMHHADMFQPDSRRHYATMHRVLCTICTMQARTNQTIQSRSTNKTQTDKYETNTTYMYMHPCTKMYAACRYMLHAENKTDIYLSFSFKQNIHTISIKFYLHGI